MFKRCHKRNSACVCMGHKIYSSENFRRMCYAPTPLAIKRLEVMFNVECCFLGSGAVQFGINLPILSGTYFLRLQRERGTVKIEVTQHSETSLIFLETKRCHIPQGSIFHFEV